MDGAKLAAIYFESGTFCLYFAKVFKFSILTSGGVELREICWGILIVGKDGQRELFEELRFLAEYLTQIQPTLSS